MFLTKNNKSSFYQIVYFVDGKRKTHSTKKTDKHQAIQYLEIFKTTPLPITKNISSEPQAGDPVTILTLSKFKDEYYEYVRPVKSKKYLDSISYSFKQLIPFCGDIPLNELTTRIVDKFINSTFNRTQRGAHLYYRTLKAAINKAVEWNYIPLNPFTKVKFPKLSKTFPVFISENELLIIIANTTYQHLKDAFTVAFYTGLRLGELINMKWDWIDLMQNQITIKCSKEFLTKSKKERIVPMSSKVRSIIISRSNSAIHNPTEFVFYHTRGKRLYPESISKQFKKIVRKSNLNDSIHFHTLRHSFASMLVQRGVSLYVVKELLGHEDLSTTQIYSHLQKQNLMDAVNLL
ncbi:MAG: tyrosine-type recombinase/integrase [Ignavibacteriaceae bacterium]